MGGALEEIAFEDQVVGHHAAGKRRSTAVEQKADLAAAQRKGAGLHVERAVEIGGISGVDDHTFPGQRSAGRNCHFLNGSGGLSAARNGRTGISANPHQGTIGTELQILRRAANGSLRSHCCSGRNVHRFTSSQGDVRAGKCAPRRVEGDLRTAHLDRDSGVVFAALSADQKAPVTPGIECPGRNNHRARRRGGRAWSGDMDRGQAAQVDFRSASRDRGAAGQNRAGQI